MEPNLEPSAGAPDEPPGADDRTDTQGARARDVLGRGVAEGAARALRVALPLLVVAAFAVLLAWAIDDKKLLLEYIKAVIWPLVVVVVLWWLRVPIREKVKDVLKLSVGAASVEFAEQAEQGVNTALTDDIRAAAQVLVDKAPDHAPPDQTVIPESVPSSSAVGTPEIVSKSARDQGVGSETQGVEPDRRVADEAARRKAIEKIIRDSAGWGWDMAQLGTFKSRPAPVIEWSDDGLPLIVYGEGQRRTGLASLVARDPVVDRTERVQRLEKAIRDLQEEIDRPAMSSIAALGSIYGDPKEPKRKQLQRFKDQLLKIDPNSPWVR